jgi:hypothetical protein
LQRTTAISFGVAFARRRLIGQLLQLASGSVEQSADGSRLHNKNDQTTTFVPFIVQQHKHTSASVASTNSNLTSTPATSLPSASSAATNTANSAPGRGARLLASSFNTNGDERIGNVCSADNS